MTETTDRDNSSSARKCFCGDEDERAEIFQPACGHAVHRLCARARLRRQWEAGVLAIDREGRRLGRVSCETCGLPWRPEDVLRLQEQRKYVPVDLVVEESDPRAVYVVSVLSEASGRLVVRGRHAFGDLEACAGPYPPHAPARRRIMYNYLVSPGGPLSKFRVRVFRQLPTFRKVLQFVVAARDLIPTEPDALMEEEQMRKVCELEVLGRLRVVSNDVMEEEHERRMERATARHGKKTCKKICK